jgi:alcohol dehydrogenase (NADP+)
MANSLKLLSGHAIPRHGLGTFLATKPGEVGNAVKAAVRAGYRLIDCAAGYGNQKEVGQALADLFAEGVCKREDLFIVSKVFQTHHVWDGVDRTAVSLQTTLADLQLDYLE